MKSDIKIEKILIFWSYKIFLFFSLMQDQIIQLLIQTRSDDNNLISSAEQSLTTLAESPEFLPSLISIMSNSEIPEITRFSAIIHMRIVINHYWNTSVSPEVKDLIKSALPSFIINWPHSHKQYMNHFIRTIIDATILNNNIEWSDLPNIIFTLLSQGSEESCRTGLVIANSLCGSIKQIKETQYFYLNGWAVSYGTALVQILTSFFSQCDSHELLALGFHCAARILISNVSYDFNSFFESLSPLVEKSFLIVNQVDSDEYYDFAYNALKFSIQYIMKYKTLIPPQIIDQYFQIIQHFLPQNITVMMKCYLLNLLYELINHPRSFEIISGNIPNFLANLMMPLFALTPDNISSLSSNPADFISDIDKSGNKFEDIRYGAWNVIHSLCENHCEIADAARIIAAQAYSNYMSLSERSLECQVILFAAFQMFSSVTEFLNDIDPKHLTTFFTGILPLFDSPEELGRSAAFFLLSKSKNFPARQQLIMKCIEHIIDEFPIARYYAVISVPNLLNKCDDIRQIQRDLANSPIIPAMFSSLFELSGRFHFSDIAGAVGNLINFFGNQLLPIASNIFTSLMNFLTLSSDSLDTMIRIICDSLEFLINLVISNKEAQMTLAPTFCSEFFNVLQSIEDHEIFDILLFETMPLFEVTPFSPTMWNAATMLIERMKEDSEISITDPVKVLSIFVIKDSEFETREVMPLIVTFCLEQMNQKMSQFDSWNEFALLASNLIMRLRTGSNQELVKQMIQSLTMMAMAQIESPQLFQYYGFDGLVILVNALLYTDMGAITQILGEKIDLCINWWSENQIFPQSAMTLVTNFNRHQFNDALLLKVITSIAEEVCNLADFDVKEIVDKEKSAGWFDFSESLMSFNQLLQYISQNKPNLYSEFLNNIPKEDHSQEDRSTG